MKRLDKGEFCRLVDVVNNSSYRSVQERIAAAAKLAKLAREAYMSLLKELVSPHRGHFY